MNNIQRLQARMVEAGCPALLVTHLANVQWLTGFTGSSGFVVLTTEQGVFVTDSRYAIQCQEQVRDLPTAVYANPVKLSDFLAQQARDLGLSQVAFEKSHVVYGTVEEWQAAFGDIALVPGDDLISALRMIKTPDEVARIRKACALADKCLEHVVRMIQPGVSEWDLLLEIEFFFRRQGSKVSFEPIAVSGIRSARPHATASEKKLEVGDFVTLDLGCIVEGYISDITRTFVVGEASARHREMYDQVLKAENACVEALVVGANGREVDALARQILDEKGLAKYFGHGLGHGIGTLVHDAGRLSPTTDQPIGAGQVWTIEPGVYIEGFGGVRIEDDVLVTENGPERLTHYPRELMVLPA